MDFKEAVAKYAKEMGISLREAIPEVEQLITAQMKADKCSREFAEASFIEDEEDTDCEELDKLEKQAKQAGTTKHKAKAVDAFGKKRTRTVKVDDEKRDLIIGIANFLQENDKNRIEIVNNQQKIDIFIGENHYSLTLTKHRPKKGE